MNEGLEIWRVIFGFIERDDVNDGFLERWVAIVGREEKR
jgi:hypothetical protein